jgi:formylglycine-generating enzyme required for sulfatase activity
MKFYLDRVIVAASLLVASATTIRAQVSSAPFVYETTNEFFTTGDFDGDGRTDIVIVDRVSGKYRLGYQRSPGTFSWVDCRPSGIKDVTGFDAGKLLATNRDALVFTSPDANAITILDVSSPTASSKPVNVPFSAGLGPNAVVALDIGGAGNTPLADLFVGSIENSPDANQLALIRNDGAEYPKLSDGILAGPATQGNRVAIKAGRAEFLSEIITGEKGDSLVVQDLSTGEPVTAAKVDGLAAGSEYAVGVFPGSPLPKFIVYKPGANKLLVHALEESAPGKFAFGKENSFDLGQSVKRVVVLPESSKLFVIFGEGEKAGVFSLEGSKAPELVQTIVSTNELLTCAASFPGGLLAFSTPAGNKFSTRYMLYKSGGPAYTFSAFGSLASLADNDNITIPDIYSRVMATEQVKSQGDMKPYTNTIPGTRVSFVMVPIPGGEFVMGSPESEAGRKPDEGPQHKVKVDPFWMEQCEVTWNEYELYMYPDEERRTRATVPSDEQGDKLADVVTHPSKPYVEMSFGMGKDGFPAISMTQHAANKYCQWLTAKTGHFYRLPTEAEWEYACRAGTTTTHFFGDDPSKLGEYAWFEANSDFKYQKVGKKKPNPWGLYDMYGNATEWVIDQYDPNFYADCSKKGEVVDPINRPTKPYPLAVRGGSWDDDAVRCRSAARRGSDRSWKMQDPQLPKSVWYFSDAQFVGFRIVRPLKTPSQEDMQKYWSSGVERD